MSWRFAEDVGISVRPDALLSECTTFQLGGPCRCLITCTSSRQLERVVGELAESDAHFVLLGGGSNVLVSDQGFEGVVVRYVSEATAVEPSGEMVTVTASTPLDALALFCAERGLDGFMCCTGIPGTVGGAIVGNAGAWGKQISDALISVELLERSGERREVPAEDLGFAYRRSLLQRSDEIVLSARCNITRAGPSVLMEERQRILGQRAARHPDLRVDPCIGSFFRNIEPSSAAGRRQAAGWFLEQAGAKEIRVGGARVFEKHANIIVKGEGCTAQDVRDLAARMAAAVREKFGIELVREVRFLGPFRGEEQLVAGFH